MKKLITLFLIISTLFSVLSLTACNLDETADTSKGTTEQTQKEELEALGKELSSLKAALDAANSKATNDAAKIAELEAAITKASASYDTLKAELDAAKAQGVTDSAKIAELEAKLSEQTAALEKERDELKSELDAAKAQKIIDEKKIEKLEADLEELQAKYDAATTPTTPPIGPGGGNRPGGDTTEDEWWEDIAYNPATLRFRLTKNTNDVELHSGCERYMEGRGSSNTAIDKMVADRNEDALYYTNIEEVIYTYYTDDDAYNFAGTFDVMYDEIYNPDLDSPDMYCNWMTDMLVASLRGCFANVYSKNRGDNFLNIEKDGYMSEVMRSATLSPEKVYLIASDYFIDAIRSFYCIPVNVELYNKTVNSTLAQDYNDDEILDINDLYAQVKNKEWTYAKLMDYCAAVYKDTNTDKADEDLKDTLGFALAMDALPAMGLVYSSSVTLINKEAKANGTGFDYYYYNDNWALYDLASAIQALAQSKGVMCVTNADAAAVGVTGTGATLLSVRQQFTSGKMLFGGITLVGILEHSNYQLMNNEGNGGFGVVPVPVYKSGDNYNTAMHNTAKVGAISFYTAKFSQCTAYLHYQSTNSTDIFGQYLDTNFVRDISDELDGNIEMLRLIRSNARASLDKLFEDAIGFFYESQGDSLLNSTNRWHAIICNAGYMRADIRQEYLLVVADKNASLDELVTQYVTLPD